MLIEENRPPRFSSSEARIDDSIQRGNFSLAKESEVENKNSIDELHKLRLKHIALPLYELVFHGPSEERIGAGMEVYAEAAALLRDELDYYLTTPEGEERERSKGRLTEQAIFCLVARDLQQEGPTVILVPTSQRIDNDGRAAADFHLVGIKEDEAHVYPLQVKTYLSSEETERYDTSLVNLIGLNQLNAHSGRPQHHNSLANTLLREINGTASASDSELLDQATIKLYESIIVETDASLPDHPHKEGWKQLAA